MTGVITWTRTDESPELTSISLLPIVKHFLAAADVGINELDISFAGRILQEFSEFLEPQQRAESAIKALADLTERADTNIIKLPNASATDNQLKDAVRELQGKGFALPTYPEAPQSPAEKAIKARYDGLTGSVVNPVLRQGNAVRSIPAAIKQAARDNPHALGEWKSDSHTRVATMQQGDFLDTEHSITLNSNGQAHIRFAGNDGQSHILKDDINIKVGDIIDTAIMRRTDLHDFIDRAIAEADQHDLLLSLHLKATMMKKTDGVIFGDVLERYFAPVFDKYSAELDALGFDPQNGMDDLLNKLETLPQERADPIRQSIQKCLQDGAPLAMANVQNDKHHLSSPNNVIVDVSMANLARWGGEVQAKDGQYGDTLAVIPDSTYAKMHQSGIAFLKAHGSPDVKTMGSVTTVRLQADGAEEYGSKNTTFTAPAEGRIELVSASGEVLNSQNVAKGDLFRLCQTSERAVQNWARLAIEKGKERQTMPVFWLDSQRAHDREIIKTLAKEATFGDGQMPDYILLPPDEAMTYTLERSYAGNDTLCVTGNLIGDHITDYFPILEIGSSAKMLSVINLLEGGLVAETGSGGTAPDLLGMIENRNHFLWDDTGTALALAEALRHLSVQCHNTKAAIMADALESATVRYIFDKRSPSPDGLDTRESHFYLAKYWAQALEQQDDDPALKTEFEKLARKLLACEPHILADLKEERGKAQDLGGRYHFPEDTITTLMRPAEDFSL